MFIFDYASKYIVDLVIMFNDLVGIFFMPLSNWVFKFLDGNYFLQIILLLPYFENLLSYSLFELMFGSFIFAYLLVCIATFFVDLFN